MALYPAIHGRYLRYLWPSVLHQPAKAMRASRLFIPQCCWERADRHGAAGIGRRWRCRCARCTAMWTSSALQACPIYADIAGATGFCAAARLEDHTNRSYAVPGAGRVPERSAGLRGTWVGRRCRGGAPEAGRTARRQRRDDAQRVSTVCTWTPWTGTASRRTCPPWRPPCGAPPDHPALRGWARTAERTVSPLGLVLKAGVWYLVALPMGADARARTYRVSNILARPRRSTNQPGARTL